MHTYNFGCIEFSVKGKGAFFTMSDNLKDKINQLSLVDAWKMKRDRLSICNRYTNVSMYGHEIYGNSHFSFLVADTITKQSYKRMLNFK